MPSQRTTKSKEDTWTTAELNQALKTDERRRPKDRDEDRKRARINGDDKHRRRKDDDTERRRPRDDDDSRRRHRDDEKKSRHREEEERERQRRERRDRREKKDGREPKKEIPYRSKGEERDTYVDVANDDDEEEDRHKRRSQHKTDREKRHRDKDDEDRERRRRHKDEDEDRDKRRKPRDDADPDEEERERLRTERRERREKKETGDDDDRKRRHEEKRDRRKDEDNDRKRDRDRDRDDREKRHRDKDKDREERKHRDKDREREERKEKEREEEREKRRKEKESKEDQKSRSSRHEEKEEPKKEEEDDYADDDFEDYDDDFEDDDGDEEDAPSAVKDSEVNDVLRALDEENDRLLTDSRQGNRQESNRWSQRDQSDEEEERTIRPGQSRPRTAINFVSAKQRAMSKRTANKTIQRGRDLLQMLELDVTSFDLLDLPPVNEYDLYIRSFGRSDTRQAYVQTNDDNIDRDIQTEEIDQRSKWTQHPSEDSKGVGRGDGDKDFDDEEEEVLVKQNKEQDTAKLNQFLEKAGQVIAILLEEGRDEVSTESGQRQTQISVSEGYTQIDLLPILEGRHVEYAHFSPTQPNMFITVYSKPREISDDNPISRKGIICVWNTSDPSYPYRILACNSQPKCACFSPVKPSLVFAGMVDGSVAMWDLREQVSMHRRTVALNQEHALRYPTYDTAGVLDNDNHHSPVTSIQPIYSYDNSSKSKTHASEESSSSGLAFQLVTTEDAAVLNFWVVAEIQAIDAAGSETDLGLAPGGRVKFLKSSSVTLENPSMDMRMKSGLRAINTTILPSDPNQFYVGTDSGFILHGVRFGNRAYPRSYSPAIGSINEIVTIDFSPFDQPCFLAGGSDGSFALYHTKSENPLVMWPYITKGCPIHSVRWSQSRPCIFYVLDTSSNLYMFDLLESDAAPKQIEQLSKERVTAFSLTVDYKTSGLGVQGKAPQMLLSLESGQTEVHTFTKALRDPEELELEFFFSFLERF